MAAAFPDCSEALENNRLIAEQCMSGMEFNGFIFPAIKTTTGESTIEYLKRESYKGAKRRYRSFDDFLKRVKPEPNDAHQKQRNDGIYQL